MVSLRPEELIVELEQFLEHPDSALESLFQALAKGQYEPSLWDGLHRAAQRDRREAELAFGYEQVTHERRVRTLSHEMQSILFDRAATFFGEYFGDLDTAILHAERHFAIDPSNQDNHERLSRWLQTQGKFARLARLYLARARATSDASVRHEHLLTAHRLVLEEQVDGAMTLEVLDQILQVEPDFADAAESLERQLLSQNRFRDAARRMESRLAPTASQDARQLQLRERLLALYTKELPEPPKAMAQVEAILPVEPTNAKALLAAESLCSVSLMAPRALAVLSDAHERTGNLDRAAALLTQELRLARGPRKSEVARRLAVLREEVLGDPAGALELLATVVQSDPSDDEARERYVRISLSLDRAVEAARQLGRAVQSVKDPPTRVKLSVDLGILQRRTGELRRARAAFEEAIRTSPGERGALRAARELVEIYSQSGEWRLLANALEIVCRHETDPAVRHDSARRLLKLCETELGEPDKCVPAWHALEDSPEADEVLSKLQAHYEGQSDTRELGRILGLRARRASDPEERKALDIFATKLWLRGSSDPSDAVRAWQGVIERHGPVAEALDSLIELLDPERDAASLAETIRQRLEITPPAEQAPLLVRLGHLYADRLGDEIQAVRCYGLALKADPTEKQTRSELARWLESPVLRGSVVGVLEPIVRAEPPSLLLVEVIKAQIAETYDPVTRLQLVREALAIAGNALGRYDEAFALAVTGVGMVLAEGTANAAEFLVSVEQNAQYVPAEVRVSMLEFAFAGCTLERPECRALAAILADALAESGQSGRAIELLRRALAEEPSSPELLSRVDDLLAAEASPEERLALYTDALQRETRRERRRDILARIATLTDQHLKTPDKALELWRGVISLDETHLLAHQSVVALLGALGDDEGLRTELRRALSMSAGERKQKILDSLVEVELRSTDHEQALAYALQSIEGGGAEDDARVARVEQLARELGHFDIVERLLEGRLSRCTDASARMKLLASLGKVRATLQKSTGASEAFAQAAELAEETKSMVRAADLLESALTAAEGQESLILRLWDICVKNSDWPRLERPLRAMVKLGVDEKDIIRRLSEVAPRIAADGSAGLLVGWIDGMLSQVIDPVRKRQLQLLRVRALGADSVTLSDAIKSCRGMLEATGTPDEELWTLYRALFDKAPDTPAFRKELRWYYGRRAELSTDPVRELLAWAEVELSVYGDFAQARGVLEKVLGLDNERLDVWTELSVLCRKSGDIAGLSEALHHVANLTDGQARHEALVERAEILAADIAKTSEALDSVEELLPLHPGDPRLLAIVRRALDSTEHKSRAAGLLEQVIAGVSDPPTRAEVLESLLQVTAGAGDFEEARARWAALLIDTHGDQFESALAVALRFVEELSAQDALWNRTEKLARRLGQPRPVIEAYERALSATSDAVVAEQVGRRLVDFFEEWTEDTEQVVPLLERVYAACGAEWAFDRLKLAFNAAGRWAELFSLYDRALERLPVGSLRSEVLREAAMAAKDFANDPERAIHYFVTLDELEPGDTRVEAAIERLYERQGLVRPLIDLLTRQMGRTTDEPLHLLRARVAGLWLDIDEPVASFTVVEQMLLDRPNSPEAIDLLERIVSLPSAKKSVFPEPHEAPTSSRKSGAKAKDGAPEPSKSTGKVSQDGKSINVRQRVAEMLRQYYESVSRTPDVVRMLEIEVEHAATDQQRVDGLRRIIRMRLEDLNDATGAFEDLTALVRLEPQVTEHRQALDELASRTNNRVRQARLLADVAESKAEGQSVFALRLESADVFRGHVQDFDRAIELYTSVLQDAEAAALKLSRKEAKKERASALTAARQLDPLLEQTRRPLERAHALERLAALEVTGDSRRRALLEAARVALTELGDAERSVRLFREQLAFESTDESARNGLILALESTARHLELIEELEVRAKVCADPILARADRVSIAKRYDTVLDRPDEAIQAWRRLRELHGRDEESFDALVDLFTRGARFTELAELLASDADIETNPERARELRKRLGDLYREPIGDAISAVRAYVSAADWELAISVVREIRQDRELSRRVCREVFDLGVAAWTAEGGDASSAPALATAWALAELGLRLREVSAYKEVVALLLEGARLPFLRSEKRALRRDAAYLCSDQLKEVEQAVEIFEHLFTEDSSDEIALSSVSRYARLLEEVNRASDVVSLWEGQAGVRMKQGDRPTAAALWVRAAALSEQWLKDTERAIADYKQGAELGLDAALEALARIYTSQAEHLHAAHFLERLCAQSSREALGERALQLAESYVAANRPEKARICLESASNAALHVGPVRRKLATLYQEVESWEPLAALYAVEASRASDAVERFRLLDAAARVHEQRRGDFASAVPLLEQAVVLEPETSSLRLRLAEAMMKVERFADAADVLRQQLLLYGTRRPKERAIVHFALARALLGQSDRQGALEELVLASRIDPAHPRILHLQARLSLDTGDLVRAERTYRALLLVLGRHEEGDAPSRAEALIDLSIIATTNGDNQRAAESIESAFEAASDSVTESLALERGLRELGRVDLLGRALRERLEHTTNASQSALALAELTQLHATGSGDLREVMGEIRRRAERIELELERTALGDEDAWAAMAQVYAQLGDTEAESRITERRVRGWLSGDSTIVDPEPLYRLATLRLSNSGAREEVLLLLSKAAEVKPDFERLEQLLRPVLEGDRDFLPVLELLEKVARSRSRSDWIARALSHRLRSSAATVAQFEEAVELARKAADLDALEPLLKAASDEPLASLLPGSARAKAELELAELLSARGEIDRALYLRESAAEFVEPEQRRMLLLEVARAASDRMQDLARAAAIYERLHEEAPDDGSLYRPLLELLTQMGDEERQTIVINRALTSVVVVAERIELQLLQARLALSRGDTGTAADMLRDVLRDDPQQSDAALLLASILERSGRYAELVILLAKQLELSTLNRDAESVRVIGLRVVELYEKQSRFEEGLAAIEVVLAWHPGNPDALRAVVRLAEALGDLERAATALEELLGLPQTTEVAPLLERLIWVRERLGDEPGVERAMLRAYDVGPGDRVLCDALVARFQARGDIAAVASVLDRAVRAYPEDVELAMRLAAAYRDAGQIDDGLAVVEGLYASGVDSAELHRERGRLLSAVGRHEEALVALEAGNPSDPAGAEALLFGIRAAKPNSPEGWQLHLGLREVELLEQLGYLEDAKEVLAGLELSFPSHLSVLSAKAKLAGASGDVAGAVDAYVGLAEVVEGEALIQLVLDLSESCERLGTPERSRAALERAVSMAPAHAPLRARLCNVYRLLGANAELASLLVDEARQIEDLAERQGRLLQIAELLGGPGGDLLRAVALLEEARELGPDNLDVTILLGRAKSHVGRTDEALELLNDCILAQRGRRSKPLARVYQEISRIQLEEGFLTDAFESLQRATEIDLRNGSLAMALGRLALEIDEHDVAQKTFSRVALMKLWEGDPSEANAVGIEGVTRPDRADANYRLALIARDSGDLRKARMLLQKALSDNPSHGQAKESLAELG